MLYNLLPNSFHAIFANVGIMFFRFVREWQTDVLRENIDKQ